jgi:phospholipid/cholesterol/gamma-HCH transport system substrate-binding protein
MPESRFKVYGLIALVLMVGAVALIIADYNHAFSRTVAATVRAERAGLLMDPGADVTLHGVTVGKVRSVRPAGSGAVLGIALDRSQVDRIPSEVTAQILAPTVFGAKYVDLVPPERPGPRPIAAGAVIEPTRVRTEINDVFASTVSLLRSVDPAKLNASLGAVSTGLQGRGGQIGDLVVQLNTYLEGLRPSLPALGRDVPRIADVSELYADVAPDFLALADDTTVTSRTLADKELAVQAFLVDLTGLADNARGFLADNEAGLRDSLSTLAPVTALTARYSPMFPCLFAGLEQIRRTEEPIIGGAQPGVHILTTLLPGQGGYRNPRDLPVVGPAGGPSCYGGPLGPDAPPSPHVRFDDGSNAFEPADDRLSVGRPPLAVQLFGPAAGPAPAVEAGR